MPCLINLSGITKKYHLGGRNIFALNQLDLSIQTNEYLAIIGASGSGKSTLMNILGCLDRPSFGRYTLDGKDIGQMPDNALSRIRNRKIGFIFQSFNLIPNLTALQNVMQPLVFWRLAQKEKIAMAQAELARVGLSNREMHLPSELSGGQRQRIAIARALVTCPSLLLADEPTGNLDSKTTAEIMKLFDRLHNEGQTVVLVTHDQEIASRCRRSITLVDGQIARDEHQNNPCSLHRVTDTETFQAALL
ncbi:ABC transporter ATP-binding protein [Thalassomonas actiniarum]|uniref:ABC transporter ATP-binding protein n=1 Tax=Thalassomonas actiniarum TaxID=485447 RepID=A0AAE9YM72_9GAMM|nr:ABC transporter ATP-binding protein [Thalassomonas actiniarum]WDD96903.1 ABC transporter ATP-binding protein [Thalassomonas actiniarum]